MRNTLISLADLLAHGRPPDHPVAWSDDRLVTWGDFRTRVATQSRHLAERSERTWLLSRSNPLEFAVALFALWHADKMAVLPPSLRAGAVASVANQVDGILDDNLGIPVDDLPEPPDSWRLSPLDVERTRLDLFTSGSTGEPKRVRKSLAQLDAEVAVLEGLWGGNSEPVLATVPHSHIYGVLFRLLWPLAGGRSFDTETCATPEHLLERLDRVGPGSVISSPSQLARMADLIPLDSLRGRVRRIFCSGGPLSAKAAADIRAALGQAPLEVFGSTETGGIAWRNQDGSGDDAWTPLPGVHVYLGEDGAISVRSPFLPNADALPVGDAAEALADGRFRLLGRLDRIVKIEEKRLALADMESRLRGHPMVAEAGVVVLPGRRQRLGAVVVLNDVGRSRLESEGRHAFAQGLRRYLGHWFDAVLLPRHWRYPAALPYDERGKLTAAGMAGLFSRGTESHG